MGEPVKLEYVRDTPRAGHSPYGIASVGLATMGFVFSILAGVFDITPFESAGNEKETRVAALAAIVGMLLGVRALQQWNTRRILAIWGLALNALALLAALVLVPYI